MFVLLTFYRAFLRFLVIGYMLLVFCSRLKTHLFGLAYGRALVTA